MALSSAPNEIVIVGYDMVTPLGATMADAWDAFVGGMSGVDWIHRYAVAETDDVKVSGEVPRLAPASFDFFSERDENNWFSPVIFHSMLVAERALAHSGFKVTQENAHRVATTFSSAIGGLDAMIGAEARVREGKTPHPFTNPNGCLNLVGGKVSILTGAEGPIFSPVAACATGAASVASAAMLLGTDRADVVIAGACDFPVIRSLLASFASMNGAFRSAKSSDRAFDNPEKVSRPFSKDRRGFVVSEGAAALIVTTREFAETSGLPIRAVIEGIGMTSDAKHYVAPNLRTITACINAALKDADRAPDEIEAINAHAASTHVGDAVEVSAIREVFGTVPPPVVANKSQIGHTMGASSALELILSIEGMKKGILLPTLNFEPDRRLAELDISPLTRRLAHHVVLSNAFGFGGCNVCLVARI
jgi:3-oxoacyl-[acyl-carrier-protein] synthase II